MSSIFAKIVNDEIPSFKVHEDKHHLAFLDINPLNKGHTLVIPKKEIDYIFDINSKEYKELWLFAQTVAKAMEKVIRCERISIVVIGLEVPHAHIHLIPIDYVYEINFALPKKVFSNIEMTEIAKDIKIAI